MILVIMDAYQNFSQNNVDVALRILKELVDANVAVDTNVAMDPLDTNPGLDANVKVDPLDTEMMILANRWVVLPSHGDSKQKGSS